MMDNIQAIISDRHYQDALENQHQTIRPCKALPTPSEEEYSEYLKTVKLSLTEILDSPIGVYSLQKYSRRFSHFPGVINFLVLFERMRNLDLPTEESAVELLEACLQLPPIYKEEIAEVQKAFKKMFGPMSFNSSAVVKQHFLADRVQSLDIGEDDDYFPSDDKYDSLGNEMFPDSTAPMTFDGRDGSLNGTMRTFLGKNATGSFGGFMSQRREAALAGRKSSVDTEMLSARALERMSMDEKLKEKTEEDEDFGEGDFIDRQAMQRKENQKKRIQVKNKSVKIFSNLAESLLQKAEELVEGFKEDSEEFREMVESLWYSEQKIDVNDFLLFRDLGRGAFGVVSSAKTKTTGALTAIKCLNKKLIKGKKAKRLVSAEKAILEVLGDNPSIFVIWLKYSFQDRDNFYMAIPLCTGGDMGFHLRRKYCFSEVRAKFHFAEILEGIDHLHALGILYRDMKPENVIFDYEGHARISDLGLAIQTNGQKVRGRAGTPGYWAPEVIMSQPYSYSADHWSLGCVLYEMLVGRCPFSVSNTKMGDRDEATMNWKIKFPSKVQMRRDKKDVSLNFPERAIPVILGLLNRNRTRRMDAKDVRAQDFFKEINWTRLRAKQLPPPWKPTEGQIYAPDQLEVSDPSKDRKFRKLKLSMEDEINDFAYVSKYSHQLDIVSVLEASDANELKYDYIPASSCCFCM